MNGGDGQKIYQWVSAVNKGGDGRHIRLLIGVPSAMVEVMVTRHYSKQFGGDGHRTYHWSSIRYDRGDGHLTFH